MRNFISIITMLAFVISMTFAPVMSHAMTLDGAKIEQAGTSEVHKCHHHDASQESSGKTSQNDKDHPAKCCEKGMCKCVGGNCHSISKLLGDKANFLSALSSSTLVFAFDNEYVDSALPNLLQRPPKA